MYLKPFKTETFGALPVASAAIKTSDDSGFHELLTSRMKLGGGSARCTPQAAAKLLQMEMMVRSLALAGDAEASEVSRNTLHLLAAGMPVGPDPAAHHQVGGRVGGQALEQVEEHVLADEAGDVGIEATAARYLGTPYRFGGEGPDGIDCSSFVQRVYLEHQVDLPRTAREQIRVGREVAQGDLRKGDLVFFQTYASYPSHVGIYLGNGKMIHASSEKGEVTVSDMNSDYYRSRYLGAKRVA